MLPRRLSDPFVFARAKVRDIPHPQLAYATALSVRILTTMTDREVDGHTIIMHQFSFHMEIAPKVSRWAAGGWQRGRYVSESELIIFGVGLKYAGTVVQVFQSSLAVKTHHASITGRWLPKYRPNLETFDVQEMTVRHLLRRTQRRV